MGALRYAVALVAIAMVSLAAQPACANERTGIAWSYSYKGTAWVAYLTKRPVVIFFTGGRNMSEIVDSDAMVAFARRAYFVLIDPGKTGDEERREIESRYDIRGAYPQVIVVDAEGRVKGRHRGILSAREYAGMIAPWVGVSEPPPPSPGVSEPALKAQPVIEVDSANIDQEVLKSTLPLYIEFYASRDCEICVKQAPVIEKVVGDYAGRVKFVRINALENAEFVKAARITSLPTHYLVKLADGAGVFAVGYLDETNLRKFIDQGLAAKANPSR